MRCSVAIVVAAAASLSAAFATVAAAADLPSQPPPYRAPAAVPAPAYSWTGLYLGVHGGGGWASDKVTNQTGTATFPVNFVHATNSPSGFLAGGYAGFNYQLSQWLVVGIDGDGSWTNISGTSTDVSPTVPTVTVNTQTKVNWLATASGRVGLAVDNWLFFGKGGWGWAGFETNTSVLTAGVNTSNGTAKSTRNGWLVGGGIEWAFAPNWLVKGEYNYMDFGTTGYVLNTTLAGGAAGPSLNRNAATTMSVAKGGIAYKF